MCCQSSLVLVSRNARLALVGGSPDLRFERGHFLKSDNGSDLFGKYIIRLTSLKAFRKEFITVDVMESH